jgi:error-prone DNA polymerase
MHRVSTNSPIHQLTNSLIHHPVLANCHTVFSHTYGSIPTRTLVELGAEGGYKALALTDINNTCTSLDFVLQCREQGINPVLGIDFRNMEESAACLYIGLAHTNEGFKNLNAFLSGHLLDKTSFPPRPPFLEDVLFIYPFQPSLLDSLGPHEYLGIRPQDLPLIIQVPEDKLKAKAMALYPLSFRDKNDYYLHCLLRAVDCNILLSKLQPSQAGARQEYFIPAHQLRSVYERYPYLIRNTEALMEQCELEFDFTLEKNRRTFTGSREKDTRLLHHMAHEGLAGRYAADNEEAITRVEKELKVISDKNFVSYFLTAWDVVRYARQQGYYHAGRGSGANSIIAYCLQITEVDPIELDLYFERFLNMHRSSPPDFDIDFSWKDRDDVIRYIFERYGSTYTAMLGSHTTLHYRGAARELGKVFGLPKDEIDHFIDTAELEAQIRPTRSANIMDIYKQKVDYYARRIIKFPRNLSVHASGLVVSDMPLHYYTATDMPPKGFPITHFDMYTADKFKLHKLDILSQRGLGHIKDCIQLVKKNQDVDINIHNVREFTKNEHLNALLKAGDTIGCFYIESPAMRQLLRKLRCESFTCLVAASSIIRPGVSESGMMRAYIQRHREPDRYKAIHPKMDEILGETYGVMVYQEDIIKVAHQFAGLSLAGADILRRAMAWKFRVDDGFEKMEKEYFDSCRAQGYSDEVSREVWRQMEGFAGFSFCKAHSASYAVESYQSLYLKTYFPLEFMVAVINNFGGYYSTEFYVNEAKRRGGIIHAPCVNRSEYLTSITGKDIFLGFIHIKSLESELAERIVPEREKNGAYKDLNDVYERLQPKPEQLLILVRIGTLRFTGKDKRQILWDAYMLTSRKREGGERRAKSGGRRAKSGGRRAESEERRAGDEGKEIENINGNFLSLLNEKEKDAMQRWAGIQGTLFPVEIKKFSLPPLKQNYRESALQEIEALGFPICSRFDLLTSTDRGDIMARDMVNNIGQIVTMVGYLTNTKGASAKGQPMQFGSFLDADGQTFEAVSFPLTYRKYYYTGKGIYRLKGRITVEYDVPTLELISHQRMEVSFSREAPDIRGTGIDQGRTVPIGEGKLVKV